MHSLRKKLIRDNTFNPFHDSFNYKKVLEAIDGHSTSNSEEETLRLIKTCKASIALSPRFTETFKYLKSFVESSSFSTLDIIHFLIALANRTFIGLSEQLLQEYNRNIEHNYSDAHRLKVDSIDPTIGKLNASNAIEGTVDTLHVAINFIQKLSDNRGKVYKDTEVNSIAGLNYITIISTSFYILKAEYDSVIWNNGYIELLMDEKRVQFEYANKEELMLKKIGFYRLQQYCASSAFVAKKQLQDNPRFRELVLRPIREKKAAKRIKAVSVNNGYLEYALEKGKDDNEIFHHIESECSVLAYYNFIKGVKLPKLKDLDLEDLIFLFDVLQSLFRKASSMKIKDDSVNKKSHFYKFPFRMKIKDVKQYLLARTTYNAKQIDSFVGVLVNQDGKRINFWDYPFMRLGEDLLFPFLTIVAPVLLHLIDVWLEEGGFSLDERGDFFEKYIKTTLSNEITRKRYYFKIPPNPNLETNDNKKEEIDLILNLKGVLIIAEVKCIKFSLEPRDHHNRPVAK